MNITLKFICFFTCFKQEENNIDTLTHKRETK